MRPQTILLARRASFNTPLSAISLRPSWQPDLGPAAGEQPDLRTPENDCDETQLQTDAGQTPPSASSDTAVEAVAEVAEEEAHYTTPVDAEPGVADAHGVLARGRNDARAENVRAAKPSPERAWSKRRTASASGSGKARGRRRQQQLPITVVGTGVGVARANSSRSQRRSPVAHETSAGPKSCDQCAREVDRTTSYRRAGKPWRLAGLKGAEGAARGGGWRRER